MTKKLLAVGFAIVSAALLAAPAGAQDKGVPPQEAAQSGAKAAQELVPLKVQLVVSRFKGNEKVSSMPYVLWVTANERGATSLRTGGEIPVPSGSGYSYRNVGTSIDCTATSVQRGYTLSITLNDSSIQFEPGAASAEAKLPIASAPAFRSFTSRFKILLRDGQTAQYTSATDPVSGEVLKVDATLNVLK